jgi:hypothetical protein
VIMLSPLHRWSSHAVRAELTPVRANGQAGLWPMHTVYDMKSKGALIIYIGPSMPGRQYPWEQIGSTVACCTALNSFVLRPTAFAFRGHPARLP